ncbi:hypothetical protein [Candidatus Mycoplasma haematohominis]|uniref:Uncharacterized protein n=1 Tax=Candidatus Mycoplasma haematohominis TaxID=1494318 RepID=A0A478FQZ0_9MOLU|nr:hypothetical protein [Candidatus Mycoplasma haemohominis]GCE63903.1 hypothetical protein MHSWG343_09100 [Candidatus Mycoplasma haemohominis]
MFLNLIRKRKIIKLIFSLLTPEEIDSLSRECADGKILNFEKRLSGMFEDLIPIYGLKRTEEIVRKELKKFRHSSLEYKDVVLIENLSILLFKKSWSERYLDWKEKQERERLKGLLKWS